MLYHPVVTAEEISRLDKLAYGQGCQEEAFMREAGRQVALVALAMVPSPSKKVLLLVGKGNNGGDAWSTGAWLLEKGIQVSAFPLYPVGLGSPMNQKFAALFKEKGGEMLSSLRFEGVGLILDGFLGTGFKGILEPKMEEAIRMVNEAKIPILAIDIPSGLNGTTGEARGKAIQAHTTVALGALKIGFFLREGYNHIGELKVASYGLPEALWKQAHLVARVPDVASLESLWPLVVRNRHKYQAGYVVGVAGSTHFQGAPKLAGMAALRSGAGIVQIFHHGEIGEIPYELIAQKWNFRAWKKELLRASSLFIGPGLEKMTTSLQKEIPSLKVPLVVDADAIQADLLYPRGAILTPHRGEVLRLLKVHKDTLEEDLLARSAKWAERHHCHLVLKGAPPFIFSPGEIPMIIPFGDPGMATAGSGDVLTGIIAALLAQKMAPHEAAVLGVSWHALAGRRAAEKHGSRGMIASDILDALSDGPGEELRL